MWCILRVSRNLNQGDRSPSLGVHVSQDGVLYANQVKEEFLDESGQERPLLLLIPVRLGLDNLNPLYYPLIKVYLFH